MLYYDYTLELLGLEDVLVTNVVDEGEMVRIYLGSMLKMQACPICFHETNHPHSYRTQTVKDLPLHGKNAVLHLRKRRYFCPYCDKVYQEKTSFLPRYQRNTTRLVAKVIEDYCIEYSTVSISEQNSISAGTAI